jgi:hypothetical protein
MLKESRITGGLYVFETGSVRAIEAFYTTLNMFANMLYGRLYGIPFTLSLYQEKAVKKDGRDTRVLRVYLEGLSVDELQQHRKREIENIQIERRMIEDKRPIGEDLQQALEDAPEEELEQVDDGVDAPDEPSEDASPGVEAEIIDITPPESEKPFSPDEDERKLAQATHEMILKIVDRSGDSYEEVLRRSTKKNTRKGKFEGFSSLHDLFVYKGNNEIRHNDAMKYLKALHDKIHNVVYPPPTDEFPF